MDISSPSQVGSLAPEATRPNAPAQANPAGAQSATPTAPAGAVPDIGAAAAVTPAAADSGVSSDNPKDASKEAPTGVDITV